jgi:hypothetical protein
LRDGNALGRGGLPPWPGSEAQSEFVTWLLYLDCGDDFARIEPLLSRWYDEACRLLVPFVHPVGAPAPTVSLTAYAQDAAGRGRRRRPARWTDGLSADLYQLSAHWFDVAPAAMASELDLYFFRFAGQRHVKLQISIGFDQRPDRLNLVLPALVELTRLMGDLTDPAYGEIVVNATSLAPATMLDTALGRSAEASARSSRVHLRGYEWVTVCPKELTERLGGPERLRASGAFAEVRSLAQGGLLLRATDSPEEYRADRVRDAFRALAPALPPGRPGPIAEPPLTVMGEPDPDLSRVVFADPRDPDEVLELGPSATLPAGSAAPVEGIPVGVIPGFGSELAAGFAAGFDGGAGFPFGDSGGPQQRRPA